MKSKSQSRLARVEGCKYSPKAGGQFVSGQRQSTLFWSSISFVVATSHGKVEQRVSSKLNRDSTDTYPAVR